MTNSDRIQRWVARVMTPGLVVLATAINSPAQFTTLVSFTGSNGDGPFQENLVQGKDGNLYGTTIYGGTTGDGIIFKITPAGKLTTVYDFANTPDGANPYAGLVLATDGNFYGTTYEGGASGLGTVFKLTAGGTLTILHSFSGADGEFPYGGLVEGTDGNLYGHDRSGRRHRSGLWHRFQDHPRGNSHHPAQL